MGKYFCAKCNFFDDDVSWNLNHVEVGAAFFKKKTPFQECSFHFFRFVPGYSDISGIEEPISLRWMWHL
jgi:hypothetical protein